MRDCATNMRARGGIDLGGTKIQAVVVDGRHQVVGDSKRPTPRTGTPEGVAAEMAGALREAAEMAGVDTADLEGLGVGSPGAVDARAGTVSQARNLPGWEGTFPLAAELENAAGHARGDRQRRSGRNRRGVHAGRRRAIQLGARCVLGHRGRRRHGADGKPWVGRGAAGEIGHVVVKKGGARCGCGRRGCMEAYAGRAAMEAKARRELKAGRKTELFEIMEKRGRERLTSGIWARALEADDKLAHELIDRAVEALGAGVASALNVLDVEAVVVGGGIGVRLGEPYVRRIEEGDDAPPLHEREPTGRPPRAAGRLRRRDRCVPARAMSEGRRPGFDGVSKFFGFHWEDPRTVRMSVRPELINPANLLSGAATYAMVDYCMGSALWVETTEEEGIATVNIAINYVQTATEGDVICTSVVDRRNRTGAALRSEVRHEDGRLLATAVGSFAIFKRKDR